MIAAQKQREALDLETKFVDDGHRCKEGAIAMRCFLGRLCWIFN